MEIQKSNENRSIFDPASFSHMMTIAEHFSRSQMIPKNYQGNPSECLIAVQYAAELRMNPLQFMQNSYVVHGKPGIEAKLAIGLANDSGIFLGPIKYKFEGEGDLRQCTAYATIKETSEVVEYTVSLADAKANKWGDKWKTLPDLMLSYRSAMFLIRTVCPQVILGLHSKDELIDEFGDKKEKNITSEVKDLSSMEIGKPEVEFQESKLPPVNVTTPMPEVKPPKGKEYTLEEKREIVFKVFKDHYGLEVSRIEDYLMKPSDKIDEEDLKMLKQQQKVMKKDKEDGKTEALDYFIKTAKENRG